MKRKKSVLDPLWFVLALYAIMFGPGLLFIMVWFNTAPDPWRAMYLGAVGWAVVAVIGFVRFFSSIR